MTHVLETSTMTAMCSILVHARDFNEEWDYGVSQSATSRAGRDTVCGHA